MKIFCWVEIYEEVEIIFPNQRLNFLISIQNFNFLNILLIKFIQHSQVFLFFFWFILGEWLWVDHHHLILSFSSISFFLSSHFILETMMSSSIFSSSLWALNLETYLLINYHLVCLSAYYFLEECSIIFYWQEGNFLNFIKVSSNGLTAIESAYFFSCVTEVFAF